MCYPEQYILNNLLMLCHSFHDIYNRGKAQDWSPTQYRAELRTMLSEFRQELRAGNIALNSKHRPWAK